MTTESVPNLGDALAPETPPVEEAPPVEDKAWYADWEDEGLRKQAEAKGWKTAEDIAKGYANAVQTRRGNLDDMVEMPTTDEGINSLLDKAGRPKDRDAYSFDGFDAESKMGNILKDHAHKSRMSNDGANDMAKDIAALMEAQKTDAITREELARSESAASLKASWGEEKFDDNMQLAEQGMKRFADSAGLTNEVVNRLAKGENYAVMAKIFTQMGALTQDHGHKGEGTTKKPLDVVVTKEDAQARLTALKADPDFVKRYHSPNKDTKKAAMAQVTQLAHIIDGK